MSQRWRKITLAADDLPLVVLWNEMLAATGIPESRAWQLVQEGTFPIRHLPYHGYSPRDQGARLWVVGSFQFLGSSRSLEPVRS